MYGGLSTSGKWFLFHCDPADAVEVRDMNALEVKYL